VSLAFAPVEKMVGRCTKVGELIEFNQGADEFGVDVMAGCMHVRTRRIIYYSVRQKQRSTTTVLFILEQLQVYRD
jgi:hypothetical protein